VRYRPLSADNDYTVGVPFLANSPACVAQAILTRLKLWQGEWFVDVTDGTPYLQQILGERRTDKNPDAAIQQRILGTPNVTSITSYSSNFDGATRTLSVEATVQTAFGAAMVSVSL